MKWIGTMVAKREGDRIVTFVISPGDDIWYADNEDLPPDLRDKVLPITSHGDMTVLGHLFQAEK